VALTFLCRFIFLPFVHCLALLTPYPAHDRSMPRGFVPRELHGDVFVLHVHSVARADSFSRPEGAAGPDWYQRRSAVVLE
jgi:hypothetical protein